MSLGNNVFWIGMTDIWFSLVYKWDDGSTIPPEGQAIGPYWNWGYYGADHDHLNMSITCGQFEGDGNDMYVWKLRYHWADSDCTIPAQGAICKKPARNVTLADLQYFDYMIKLTTTTLPGNCAICLKNAILFLTILLLVNCYVFESYK